VASSRTNRRLTRPTGSVPRTRANDPRRSPALAATNRAGARLVPTDPRNPPPSSLAVRAVMSANRASATGPERELLRALAAQRVRPTRTNARIAGVRVDLLFARARLAVFVHGCFWHACRVCRSPLPRRHSEFWRAKFKRNRARDLRQKRLLERQGLTVIEIWGHELENDAARTGKRLARLASSRRRKSTRPKKRSRRGQALPRADVRA